MRILLVLALGFGAFACNQEVSDIPARTDTTLTEAVTTPETFGAAFEPTAVRPATSLTTAYSPEQLSDTLAVQLRGTVNEVCQAKGCWMTIAAGEETEMMVKFKDYGFFMPKDIDGRELIMNGIAFYQTTSVDELRHYAEDAGDSPEAIAKITEPKRELRFLADGVRLLPRG